MQPSPDGLAQAFIIGEDFIGDDCVAMVLGDNIFTGHGLNKRLKAAVENAQNGKGATVFGYYVDDPERFGIVEFDKNGKAISIEEKPEHPKSNYCVTGLYFYDNRVVEFAKNLKPSDRGELEITDLNCIYLEDGSLNVNPNSLTKVTAYVEPALMEAKGYDSFQFVRNGFFCVDAKDSRPDALVFNRIVSLKSSFKLPKKD